LFKLVNKIGNIGLLLKCSANFALFREKFWNRQKFVYP